MAALFLMSMQLFRDKNADPKKCYENGANRFRQSKIFQQGRAHLNKMCGACKGRFIITYKNTIFYSQF